MNFLFKFKSIRTAMLIPFITLITIAVLCYMLISVRQNRETVLDTSTDYTWQLITMINGDIDSYFSNMENIAQLIMTNSNVRNYLYSDSDSETLEMYRDEVSDQFQTLKDTRDDIYNIGIVTPEGRYFINNEDVEINPYADVSDMEWFQDAMRGGGKITSSHVQNLVKDEYKWVVTLSRGITNLQTGKIDGVLFIDLNYSSISSLCEKINLGSKGYVFILDQDGSVIYHPKQQLLYSGILDENIDTILANEKGSFISEDGERLYTISKSKSTGWTVVGVAYLDELMAKSYETQLLYIIIAVVLIFVATLFSVIVAETITKPIRTLRSSMKRVEEGHLEIRIENTTYNNEMGDLVRSFNLMLEQIKELIRRNIEEQEEKRKSEFRALQAQINPHFLYNTLDSIIWMAESEQKREVILMTSSLAKLLRKSISNQEEIVTIADEIDYVREYLNIQQMRYHDKLKYTIEIDPAITREPIVKLTLQPLVENAIYHGIKLKAEMGTIRISGKIELGKIIIRISDDGKGMDAEALATIFQKRVGNDNRKVGVSNVNRRIQLYYGTEYGLEYESEPEAGTTVSVILPYREVGNSNEN